METPLRTRTLLVTTAAALAIGVTGAGRVAGYPEPRIVTDSWALDFEHDKPAVIEVTPPGQQRSALYWYMTYTVRNGTGAEQLFIPDVWMMTDAGDLVQANRRIPPAVFKTIKKRERNPLLESPVAVVGRLLQGEDNARDGVVIWKVPEHDVDVVRIFFAGLSGETHQVTDPVTGDQRLLRKTLMITYGTPGDAAHQALKPFVFEDERWIVR